VKSCGSRLNDREETLFLLRLLLSSNASLCSTTWSGFRLLEAKYCDPLARLVLPVLNAKHNNN